MLSTARLVQLSAMGHPGAGTRPLDRPERTRMRRESARRGVPLERNKTRYSGSAAVHRRLQGAWRDVLSPEDLTESGFQYRCCTCDPDLAKNVREIMLLGEML